jgi:predicted nucleotidyltransferase
VKVTRLHDALIRLASDLRDLQVKWAQVGGLAVSVRAEPRNTRDIDLAVAAPSDREAEALIQALSARGYAIDEVLEQTEVNRLATVRLLAPGGGRPVVDLLFASSGIEPELVAAAEPLEVLADVVVPVARLPHLLALKVLAAREQDLADAHALLVNAGADDLRLTREALALISGRGFARGKNLMVEFEALLSRHAAGLASERTVFRPRRKR